MSVELVQMNKHFQELNKRCKAIVYLLIEHIELEPHQLKTLLKLTERQVRYNIEILRNQGFIKNKAILKDMRRIVYRIGDNIW